MISHAKHSDMDRLFFSSGVIVIESALMKRKKKKNYSENVGLPKMKLQDEIPPGVIPSSVLHLKPSSFLSSNTHKHHFSVQHRVFRLTKMACILFCEKCQGFENCFLFISE